MLFCVFASLLFLLLCFLLLFFFLCCSLLRVFSVFAAFCFSSCFLVVLLDCKCSYNYMKNSTSRTSNKSSKYKRSNKNNKSNSNNMNNKRNKNNYNGKGGTQLERSCLCVPWVEALRPLPHALVQLFLFCCVPCFHFWPFWFLCVGVKCKDHDVNELVDNTISQCFKYEPK